MLPILVPSFFTDLIVKIVGLLDLEKKLRSVGDGQQSTQHLGTQNEGQGREKHQDCTISTAKMVVGSLFIFV